METATIHKNHGSEIIYNIPANTPEQFLAGSTFLFAAYSCALTERQTPSGMYVYTAVSLTTGAKVILSRRKNQLAESGFENMAAKIHTLSIRGNSSRNVDKKPDEAVTRENKLINVGNHIFKKILPLHGYAVRDRQIELSEHILRVIGQRGITLAESEVGTGKTHAYLIAALLAKRGRLNDGWIRGHYTRQGWAQSAHMPVVISTSSIALQKAIVTDYIPELSKILQHHGIIRTPLTAAIRKGREHYICEKRLYAYYNVVDTMAKKQLKPYIGLNAPFDLTGVGNLTPYMKRRICVSEKCSDNCKYLGKCRYADYIEYANDPKVDFQITNHNYFLADTLHRASGRHPLLPNYQLVVIDEAHKFLQAARQMYGVELADKEIPVLMQEIHALTIGKSIDGVNVHRLAKKLEDQNGKVFHYLNDNLPKTESTSDSWDDRDRLTATMDDNVSMYLDKITGTIVDLTDAFTNSYTQKLYVDRKSKAIWRLSVLGRKIDTLRKPSRFIHWLEKNVEGNTKNDSFCAVPKNLDTLLHHDLWDSGIPIILTSGTLSASGDFTRIKETLGLDYRPKHKLFDTTMPSPFDYKNNTMLYISESVPFPDNKDKQYIIAIADEVEQLVRASNGHAAVLFTSYNAMGQVHAILKNRNLPFPLFRLERGSVHAIEQFRKSGNGILLASGALWEGIDIPGDTLSMLIIVKLPFAVPDPIGDYERSLCSDMATYKARAIIPDMLVKLKQGYGRLIRSEYDTGVCAILDSRANRRGAYRQRVLSALPKCNITSNYKAVRDFYLDKKPAAYFFK